MATAYDEIPYANLPFAQTRPAVLATVATLHGLTPPDPREARVLELGCGAGANLAGIAAANPGVRAVGVDLAPTAVEVAQATAAAAGLENVTFNVGDVLALTEGELGEFDYVIVHGLYAWAPEHVREAVLASCRSHLSPHGIAYLSYTAHPGGHMRQMLREMAQWHARGLEEPLERADRARGLFTLLDQLGESAGPSFYSGVVGEDVHALATAPDSMLVHDLLGSTYAPVWFTDFAAAIARHGMAYVGDASPESSREPPWSPAVSAFVDASAGDDRVAREQYFDLLVMRRFRSSLVCHADRAPAPRVDRAAVRKLFVALDSDEAPEAIRAALVDGPVPFATLRERLGADAGTRGRVAGPGLRRRGDRVPCRAVARLAGRRSPPARKRAGAVAGQTGCGRDDAAQSGRADHRRADGRAALTARRHPRPGGDPRGIPGRA